MPQRASRSAPPTPPPPPAPPLTPSTSSLASLHVIPHTHVTAAAASLARALHKSLTSAIIDRVCRQRRILGISTQEGSYHTNVSVLFNQNPGHHHTAAGTAEGVAYLRLQDTVSSVQNLGRQKDVQKGESECMYVMGLQGLRHCS